MRYITGIISLISLTGLLGCAAPVNRPPRTPYSSIMSGASLHVPCSGSRPVETKVYKTGLQEDGSSDMVAISLEGEREPFGLMSNGGGVFYAAKKDGNFRKSDIGKKPAGNSPCDLAESLQ